MKLISKTTSGECSLDAVGSERMAHEFTVKRYPMATKSKSAHWQAAFRRRMLEAGLKSVTLWMPKEGADRLARYPEKERGEVITRALVLLESQGELTGEPRGEEEGEVREDTHRATSLSRDSQSDTLSVLAQAVEALSTRLERVEATLSAIGKLTGEAAIGTSVSRRSPEDKREVLRDSTKLTVDELPGLPATPSSEAAREATDKLRREEAVTLTETPLPPVAELAPQSISGQGRTELTDTHPARLPSKRIPTLIRKAKKLSAKGLSWKKIAAQWNAEGIPTHSGIGKWHGSTVAKLVRNE
jgi:hypothetical protein